VEIEFLDHSTVELVDFMGGDLRTARAAWVSQSYDSREKEPNRVEGLINFLEKNRHTSPSEHSVFTFYVKTPIFVAREFVRHRTQSINEISGRYTKMKPVFYVPGRDRPLIQTGKIGGYTFDPGNEEQYFRTSTALMQNATQAWVSYLSLKELGIANEVARDVLPLSLYTEFYTTMNSRNLKHFLGLRTADDALYEIRDVAKQMEQIFAEQMPISYRAWKENSHG
jgi:thymidylate synthase (FAD)